MSKDVSEMLYKSAMTRRKNAKKRIHEVHQHSDHGWASVARGMPEAIECLSNPVSTALGSISASTKQHRTVLGFDYGSTKMGIAVGQNITGTTTPLVTVRVSDADPDWHTISELIRSWAPDDLVVGMPLNMDGTEHALTDAARRFQRQLQERYHLPVHLVDERLTSIEANHILASRGKRRKRPYTKETKEELDQIAAQLIIQTWFNQ